MSGPRRRLWGGRQSGKLDPDFAALNDSLAVDRVLLVEEARQGVAYAAALHRAGVLGAGEARDLARAFARIGGSGAAAPLDGSEDVHAHVEARLEELAGSSARKIHTGRSRNDQVATDLKLHVRDAIAAARRGLVALAQALLAAAARDGSAVLPAYTHLRRAQPILWAHYLLAFVEMLERDDSRLADAARRLDECPLGSGAVAGTPYAIGRAALARDLGFSRPTANSVDAVSDRDFILDYLQAAALCLVHLSRLSEDLILYGSEEFGFVRVDDSVSTGSSLMPQKRNPDSLEIVRASAALAIGDLTAMMTLVKGLPMSYDKDLQDDKLYLFRVEARLGLCLKVMTRTVATLSIDPRRMRAAAADASLLAVDLADYLVGKGVAFRDAHTLVSRVVAVAEEAGKDLRSLPLAAYRSVSTRFTADLYAWLDLDRALARRREVGGTAPQTVKKALRAAQRRVERRRIS